MPIIHSKAMPANTCNVDHYHLSDSMVQGSLQAASIKVNPIITASTAPVASFFVPMIQVS